MVGAVLLIYHGTVPDMAREFFFLIFFNFGASTMIDHHNSHIGGVEVVLSDLEGATPLQNNKEISP